MLGVGFLAVEDAFAGGVFGRVVECAEPAGEVEVLRCFVTFPVGFAAEGFGAVRECAAVRAFVAFSMFSKWFFLLDGEAGVVAVVVGTYFISQRRRVRFEQTSHWNQSCFSSVGTGASEDVSSERRSRAAERIFCSI